MNYETESWYKLYIRESTEDKVLPVLNRALRDFLLRLAKSRDDGTILNKTTNPGEDIARALGAHPSEAALIAEFVQSMISDGYLTHRRGRLWITNFVEAQRARTPGARRQKTYRDKKEKSRNVSGGDNADEHNDDVTRDAHVTSQEIRSDPKRSDPIRSDPNPPVGPPVGDKPKRRKPKIPIPVDWAPKPRHAEKATRLGLNLEDQAQRFRNNAEGKDLRWADWDKAFDNWLSQAADYAQRGPGARPPGLSDHERLRREERLHAQALRGEYGPKAQERAQSGTLDLGKLWEAIKLGKLQRRDPVEAPVVGRLPAVEVRRIGVG